MIKSLFFDIDGTLTSFTTHTIPLSTVSALTAAKEKGIRIIISTGRPPQIITNLQPIHHLIDGYISTNGAYCYIGQTTVKLCTIPSDDVTRIVDYCDRLNTAIIAVGMEAMVVHNAGEQFERLFRQMLNIHNISTDEALFQATLSSPITQLTPFISPEQESEIMCEMPRLTSGRWHPEFTDITSRDADKAQGLMAMAEAMGIGLDQTMAFGDGGNDIPILRQAAIGVAMGNADDEIKQHADYVTESVDDDGILLALQHFGII